MEAGISRLKHSSPDDVNRQLPPPQPPPPLHPLLAQPAEPELHPLEPALQPP
jgi:hypothetical protein